MAFLLRARTEITGHGRQASEDGMATQRRLQRENRK